MIKRISHVAPIQFGTVVAVTYALLSLVFVPFFIVFALIAAHVPAAHGTVNAPPMMVPGGLVGMAIAFPIIYGVLGFIFGVIAAFVYNLVAGWTGGIEFTLADVAPALPTTAVSPTNY